MICFFPFLKKVKGLKDDNLKVSKKIIFFILTYHCKNVFINKTMELKKGAYDKPSQNDGLIK